MRVLLGVRFSCACGARVVLQADGHADRLAFSLVPRALHLSSRHGCLAGGRDEIIEHVRVGDIHRPLCVELDRLRLDRVDVVRAEAQRDV